jgi:DNA-binding NarL/FixJ family response regulator
MKNIRIMIVSLPGVWQRVLQKNIEAHPDVNVIGVVSGSLSALQHASQHQPDLVLIDSSIPYDDAIVLIRKLKTENPKTLSIAITDTTQQRRKIIQMGADYTLSAYNFETQISDILNQAKGTLPQVSESSDTTYSVDPYTSK